jgi:hypothetical protein
MWAASIPNNHQCQLADPFEEVEMRTSPGVARLADT